jgi:hypothetical protein
MREQKNRRDGERSRHFDVCLSKHFTIGETLMRGMLLWLLGIPLPIVLLLYLFHVI